MAARTGFMDGIGTNVPRLFASLRPGIPARHSILAGDPLRHGGGAAVRKNESGPGEPLSFKEDPSLPVILGEHEPVQVLLAQFATALEEPFLQAVVIAAAEAGVVHAKHLLAPA